MLHDILTGLAIIALAVANLINGHRITKLERKK